MSQLSLYFKLTRHGEIISLGPACWMWDYLRRSRTAGYFVPLSGGIDSCATAVITYSMCREVVKACAQGSEPLIPFDLSWWIPKS